MSQTNGVQGGADALQARLTDPSTVAALTRLLDRIDQLETTVIKLADAVEQGPAYLSMVTDTVDETMRQADASGIDVDARLRSGLVLAEKLTEPQTVRVLGDLVDRIDRLETLVGLADQAPGLISMVADSTDEMVRQASASGVDVEERLRAALAITAKLTAPDTLAVLDKLAARAPELAQTIEMLDQAPGMVSMAIDSVDELYRESASAGVDFDLLLRQGTNSLVKFSTLVGSDEFDSVLNSGILDPESVAIVGSIGSALADCQADPPRAIGITGLLRAMRDPDVQQALGFLVSFGRRFGANLNKMHQS